MAMVTCCACGLEQPREAFSKAQRSKRREARRCLTCVNAVLKEQELWAGKIEQVDRQIQRVEEELKSLKRRKEDITLTVVELAAKKQKLDSEGKDELGTISESSLAKMSDTELEFLAIEDYKKVFLM
jgi:SMC interacting uncharacterized protein involved in chromosome segregation